MTPDRSKELFAQITRIEVHLSKDPRSLGPLYLQNLIAECRNKINAISRIELEVAQARHEITRRLMLAETAYEASYAEVLAGDERVRRLPAIEDRKATINVILRDNVAQISTIKAELHDLDFLDKAVRLRHRELTATMSEIKVQRSIIRDEIDSGAMYGDERGDTPKQPTSSKGPLGIGDFGMDEDGLDALLEKVTEELPVEEGQAPPSVGGQETAPQPPSGAPQATEPESDAAKVQEFLGVAPTSATTDDFDDVLAKI